MSPREQWDDRCQVHTWPTACPHAGCALLCDEQKKYHELEQSFTELKMQSDREATSMARKVAEAKNRAAEMEVELADAKAAFQAVEEYKAKAEQLQVWCPFV